MSKIDGTFDVNKYVVELIKTNPNVHEIIKEGNEKLRENCAKQHPPGTKIKYDLSYFFRWYGISGKIPQDKVFDATVVDCIHADGTCHAILICVNLPKYVDFSDTAYELMRCKKNNDGTWLLYVINDPKLVIL